MATWRLEHLREIPGEWRCYPTRNPAQAAWRINKGVIAAARSGEFEAKVEYRQLWIRYVGEPLLPGDPSGPRRQGTP